MPPARIIAIDGPAGSGKSTIAQRLAQRLGYLYFDTGVMYRAVTLAALRGAGPVGDEQAVEALARKVTLDVRPPSMGDGRQYDVLLDGFDVTWELRSQQVDANVSQVSMYAGVRQAMSARQREIGLRGAVVMVGRDIGTVVLPEADLKVYLDASVEERARRRWHEAVTRGEAVMSYEDVLQAMRERDRIDSTRQVAPLKVAAGAVVLDSTNLEIDQVVARVWALAAGDSPAG
ncbi:MAG: (d)CMP kinase [Anaerolineales bacterium]|nr:(d)CMP kinase [Anaerolineales bacterium]